MLLAGVLATGRTPSSPVGGSLAKAVGHWPVRCWPGGWPLTGPAVFVVDVVGRGVGHRPNPVVSGRRLAGQGGWPLAGPLLARWLATDRARGLRCGCCWPGCWPPAEPRRLRSAARWPRRLATGRSAVGQVVGH